MLTLYNFALDSRGREEEKKDNPCNTKQVAQEKREREKKAQRRRRVLPKEKENTELKWNKCEDRKTVFASN